LVQNPGAIGINVNPKTQVEVIHNHDTARFFGERSISAGRVPLHPKVPRVLPQHGAAGERVAIRIFGNGIKNLHMPGL